MTLLTPMTAIVKLCKVIMSSVPSWSAKSLLLGINFSYNKTLANKENYCDLAIDCHPLLNVWKQHWVSLARKIQVFKSLVASKPVYATSMVSILDSFVQEIKSLHKEFIWSNRKPKIKHTALIGDYVEGGLKDIDIESKLQSIKISWVRRLEDSNFHPWKELATYFLLPLGGDCFSFKFKFGAKPQSKVFLFFIVK